MKVRYLGCFAIVLLATGASCSGPPADLGVATYSIIGGSNDNSHPAVGALGYRRRTFCTATAIGTRVVLTAAHCIDAAKRYAGTGATIEFRIDKVDSAGKVTTQWVKASTFHTHPKWTQNAGAGNDMGIVILATAAPVIPIRHNIKPLDSSWVGKMAYFLGYGVVQTRPSRIGTNTKQGVKIPITKVTADRVTTQVKDKSICSGDSGGPALYQIDGAIRVFAVNSYVSGSSAGGQPYCDGSGTSFRTDAFDSFIRPFLVKYPDGDIKCKADAECGACARCDNDKCKPRAITTQKFHCQPCKDDMDCVGGVCAKLEDGYRCVQRCTSDNCCPSGAGCSIDGGSQGLCMPDKGTCPPVACTLSSQCGLAGRCEKGKCVPDLPPRGPALCHPCKSAADCDPKALCVGPNGAGICLQACGLGDFCPAGFSCVSLYPGMKQCQPSAGACTATCAADSQCPKDYQCASDGTCKRKGGGGYGDPCDKSHPCRSGFGCVQSAMGYICVQQCGYSSGKAGSSCNSGRCDSGLRCYQTSGGQACLARCASGNQCPGGGYCYQGLCVCQNDGQCGSGKVCNKQVIGYLGACTSSNDPGMKKCPAGQECSRAITGGMACRNPGAGPQGLGQRCDSFVRCQQGMICTITGSTGRCIEDCSKTRTCKLGGVCTRVYSSSYWCLCRGNDCGPGRTCNKVFSGSYGYCEPKKDHGCAIDADCPGTHMCVKQQCVPRPPKEVPPPDSGGPPEPVPSEPKPELPADKAADAGPGLEPVADAGPQPDVIQPENKPGEAPGPDKSPPLPDGCSCSTMADSGEGNLVAAGLSLLFLAGLRRLRRREQR